MDKIAQREIDQSLLHHSVWDFNNPHRQRLVRFQPLPDYMNPFFGDGVVIHVAGIPGDMPNSKIYVAYHLFRRAIQHGLINSETRLIEASSGNTGVGLAKLATELGLQIEIVMPADSPSGKSDAIKVFGAGVSVLLHSSQKESSVAYARRKQSEPGYYHFDQYASPWNPQAHELFLAPQLFANRYIDIFVAPAGTMGTCMGIYKYVLEKNLSTIIIPVVCEEGQEVPGARSLRKIEEDVLLPWQGCFPRELLEYGSRADSFYLSFLSWRAISQTLGPSFGLALRGAFRRLLHMKRRGELEKFQAENNRPMEVVVFGPDDNRAYFPLYGSTLTNEQMSQGMPANGLPEYLIS
jgi:cysteine synthase